MSLSLTPSREEDNERNINITVWKLQMDNPALYTFNVLFYSCFLKEPFINIIMFAAIFQQLLCDCMLYVGAADPVHTADAGDGAAGAGHDTGGNTTTAQHKYIRRSKSTSHKRVAVQYKLQLSIQPAGSTFQHRNNKLSLKLSISIFLN